MKRFILLFLGTYYLFASENPIFVIKAEGIINPIMSSFIINNINNAVKKNATFVIIELDTPGGLLESTREITRTIINAKIPVIGYVSPKGARAASAGLFIMLACDNIAMAPYTHIGAAHPIQVGFGGQQINKKLEQKILQDTIAYVTELARMRKRNVEIAKKMVTDSLSLVAHDALKNNLIDFEADDIAELLRKLENRIIKKANIVHKIQTEGKKIVTITMNLIERFLYHIAHPTVAYILLIFGIYGIIAEFSTPGIGFPGVVGSICLLLAFYSLSLLPINLIGLLLILLGIILLILEVRIPSAGILAIGGIGAFLLGSLMLFRTVTSPYFRISIPFILAATVFTAIFFFVIAGLGLKVQAKKITTGREGIIGQIGITKTRLEPEGTVFVLGEYWKAMSDSGQPIDVNKKIKVINIRNLWLIVQPLE